MKKHTMNVTITAVDHGDRFEIETDNKVEANGEALMHMTAAVFTMACMSVAKATKKEHGVEDVPHMVKAFVAEVTRLGAKDFLDKFTDSLSEDEQLAMMISSLHNRVPSELSELIEAVKNAKTGRPQNECNCPACQALRKRHQ